MLGDIDPDYVLARKTLLDVVDGLGEHRDAVVLVGAQAVYLHTGHADLRTDLHTTDADLAMHPHELPTSPLLEESMTSIGYTKRKDQPGGWLSPAGILVGFLVPEDVAGPGQHRRSANLGIHGRWARRAPGLEGALVDRERRSISAFDSSDMRSATLWVAGPAALVVAKVYKIEERIPQSRAENKDALDILRLLRGVRTADLVAGLTMLRSSDLAGSATEHALARIPSLFGERDAPGVAMAVAAAGDDEDPDTIAASMVALATDLVDACG